MTGKQKNSLIRIIISAVLLVICHFLRLDGIFELIAYLIPYAIIGYKTLWGAFRKILGRQLFDEELLMSIATVGALCLGEYAEASAVMLFYEIGELFQSIAVGKSRRSIAALSDICPEIARVLRGGEYIECDPSDVMIGETVRVLPGERIPLDSKVISGASTLDTSALTGESLPREVGVGDEALSGCVNLSGVIELCVEKEFSDSAVSRILELVENSSEKKSKTESFITRFARVYTPCVVLIALLIAFVPPIFLGGLAFWVKRGLLVLLVSCPCALVISVPLAFFGGIGAASRQGVLVKGSEYLEALASCDTFVFDKTGTLTKGSFEVSGIYAENGDADGLLRLAASAERYSNHPVAKAIAAAYSGDFEDISELEEIAGKGISCKVGGALLKCGNAGFVSVGGGDGNSVGKGDGNTACIGKGDRADGGSVAAKAGGSCVYLSLDGKYLGYIALEDTIKDGTAETLEKLRRSGAKKYVMLSGDRRAAAEKVASELALDGFYAELLPQDKLDRLSGLIAESRGKVAYVGDGINDAPCLRLADVGISMGTLGSDAAVEASDVVLTDDSIAKLVQAVKIAKKTVAISKENIVFALAVKFAVILLGTLGFTNMLAAIFADVGVCIIAILNSMRTLK